MKMAKSKRIVVLDGYTLNPGDLSWAGLQRLGECSIFERTLPSQTISRAMDAEIVLTNKTPLDRATICALSKLKYIGVLATGFNVVDIKAARDRQIPVTNVPAYGTQSVAQMTFAHILELTQQVGHHAASVRQGVWSRCSDFCYWERPLFELAGAAIGIVGYGRIGKEVARLAQAFGMKAIATRSSGTVGEEDSVVFCSLEQILQQSDVVSLHCPLTPKTHYLIDAKRLRLMKKTAYLVNTARGALVDETALAAALNEGRLAGAGLDVLETEPPRNGSPLCKARNCYITPHTAWATRSARERLLEMAAKNVENFMNDSPTNVVNQAS